MSKIKKILDSRSAGIVCLLFAIANRIIFTSLYSLVGVDTKTQLVVAENILAGKGMGISKYFTSDLTTPVFDTQQTFPPGFSLAIIPFLKLFNGDEYKAVLTFDIATAVFFVFLVRCLGKKVGLSNLLNNIVTLVAGCSQYFFFMSWSSTDAIGVCLLLLSVISALNIINKKENIGLLKTVGVGILFCWPFIFRFMYLPIVFIIPLFIAVTGMFLKNKQLRQAGLKVFFVCAALIALYFIINSSASRNALYVTKVGRGFFPDQFTEWYPFIPASFINIDFAAQLVQSFAKIDYSSTITILKISNGLVFLLLVILLWRYIRKQMRSGQFTVHFMFIALGSFISFTILLLLAWLTLTYKSISWGFYKWTHVQDPRYFAFIYIFLPLVLFACVQHCSSSFKKIPIKIFTALIFCCLTIEVLHGVYYNGKILASHPDLNYIRNSDKGFRIFPELIKKIENENPGKEIIVCSPDNFYLLTASQMNYKAIFDFNTFLNTDMKVTSNTILIMPIHASDVVIIKDYMEKKNPALYFTTGETNFYIQEITPR